MKEGYIHKTPNSMKFLEKTLEDIIFSNLLKVHEKGLDILGNGVYVGAQRQVQLGDYGIADLITVEFSCTGGHQREIVITIIECKLEKIDLNAYQQVKRYKAGIKSFLKEHNLLNTNIEIKTVLIGSEFCSKGDFPFVYNDDKTCKCYTYSYDFNGISFSMIGKGWVISDTYAPVKIRQVFTRSFKDFIRAVRVVCNTPEHSDEQL